MRPFLGDVALPEGTELPSWASLLGDATAAVVGAERSDAAPPSGPPLPFEEIFEPFVAFASSRLGASRAVLAEPARACPRASALARVDASSGACALPRAVDRARGFAICSHRCGGQRSAVARHLWPLRRGDARRRPLRVLRRVCGARAQDRRDHGVVGLCLRRAPHAPRLRSRGARGCVWRAGG